MIPASVILRVSRVRQVENDRRMRPGTTTITSEDILKVNSSVEAQTTVRQDINPMTLVVSRSVQDRDLALDALDPVSLEGNQTDGWRHLHHQPAQSTQ